MAKIRRPAKPNIRKTVRTKNMSKKVEERPLDVRLRQYEVKPYK